MESIKLGCSRAFMSYQYTYMRSKLGYKHKCDQNPNKLQIRDQIQMKCDGINSAVPPEGSSVLSQQWNRWTHLSYYQTQINTNTAEHAIIKGSSLWISPSQQTINWKYSAQLLSAKHGPDTVQPVGRERAKKLLGLGVDTDWQEAILWPFLVQPLWTALTLTSLQ